MNDVLLVIETALVTFSVGCLGFILGFIKGGERAWKSMNETVSDHRDEPPMA